MFCSTSIRLHLLRGLGACALLALAFYLSAKAPSTYFLLIPPMVVGAFFLLRGCPMCWLMGLFETAANRKAARDATRHPPNG